jgi:glutathione peroxidase
MLIIALPVLAKAQANCAALFDQPLRRLHSTDTVDLCALTAGKAVLVVNTASHCGFTPQFEGLEALYKKYRKQGFEVIGFASDDFFQEDNDESEAANICYVNFGVTFTMLAPTHVRGKKANSVFKVLNQATRSPSWNFNKYLVSANGEQIQHFGSRTKPDDKKLSAAIENLLQEH